MCNLPVALSLRVLEKCIIDSNYIKKTKKELRKIKTKTTKVNHHELNRNIYSPAKANNITNMQIHKNLFIHLQKPQHTDKKENIVYQSSIKRIQILNPQIKHLILINSRSMRASKIKYIRSSASLVLNNWQDSLQKQLQRRNPNQKQ